MKDLIRHYFSEPTRQLTLGSEQILLRQNGHNDRLYYVLDGELEGYFENEDSDKLTKVFTASEGAFIGVHSFFSGNCLTSSTVITKSRVKLAWIDRDTTPVDPEKLGSLSAQFMPVMVNELSYRQRRTTHEALEKEKALQRLYTAEQMTTLGQLAAGIAHELNNAIGVVSSKTERFQQQLLDLLEAAGPNASQYFNLGLRQGQTISSKEVRELAKTIHRRYGLSLGQSKALARALGDDTVPASWLSQPEEALKYWQMGRDLHDLSIAARYTVSIVKSVKQLGKAESEPDEMIDIHDTISKALSLLQSDLRRVDVRFRPSTLPKIKGSAAEFVQVWSNIIKNACDAMERTDQPHIDIQTKLSNQRILVTIANNGPEIDEQTRRKIFQPNFTTKKGGLSFGLGLGLSIVKRIISENGGTVVVKSDKERTIFRVKLPLGERDGQA